MTPSTKRYLRSLEWAVVGAVLPVVNDLLQEPHLSLKTAGRSLVACAITAAYSFFRMNPPPEVADPPKSTDAPNKILSP